MPCHIGCAFRRVLAREIERAGVLSGWTSKCPVKLRLLLLKAVLNEGGGSPRMCQGVPQGAGGRAYVASRGRGVNREGWREG